MTHRGRPVDLGRDQARRAADRRRRARRYFRRRADRGGASALRQYSAGSQGALAAARRRPLWRVQRFALPLGDRAAHFRFHPVDGPFARAACAQRPRPRRRDRRRAHSSKPDRRAVSRVHANCGSIAAWFGPDAPPCRCMPCSIVGPSEPQAIEIVFDGSIYLVRLRRHRQARRYTLRIQAATREVILTIPPRGTLKEARAFAQKHGGWIAARLGRLPEAAPFADGVDGAVARRAAPDRASPRRARHGMDRNVSRRRAILCVAGTAPHINRRIGDYPAPRSQARA